MKNTVSHNPVVIIGGGVAGLTAANLLARDGFQVLGLPLSRLSLA